MNKKGNASDMPFAVVSFVVFAVLVVISGALVAHIIGAFQASDNQYAEVAWNNTQEIPAKATAWGDFTFVMLFAGTWLILFVSAFFIRVNTLFIGLGVIMLILTVIMSAVFSNYFLDFLLAGDTIFAKLADPDVSNNYPLTIFIMQYLPYLNAILGAVLLIILYSKLGDDQ